MPTLAAPARRLLVIALLATAACRREQPRPSERPPPVPIDRPSIVAPRRLASAAAFDIAASSSGAFLAFGPPGAAGGGVKGVLLDRFGTAQGPDVAVYEPRVPAGASALDGTRPEALELAAAFGGGRVGVVWVDREQGELTLRGSLGEPRSRAFSPAASFGETDRASVGARGYVAIEGSPAGTFLALLRTTDGPCSEGSASTPCGRLSLASLTPEGLVARGIPLLVPSPCTRAVVGVVAAQGRFHYAVCANVDARPSTTVYTIQEEPSYARADTALPGCEPRAMFSAGNDVIVAGACAGGPAAARLSPDANALRPVSMERLAISCAGSKPVVDGGADGLRIELDAPTAHVGSLFPESIVPARARAVWTGAALLVAQPIQGEVVVHRYQCEDGELRRTDVL